MSPKDLTSSSKQESLGESTRGSTTNSEPEKFHCLPKIYTDILEEGLDPDDVEGLITYREVVVEMTWYETMKKEL